MRRTKTDAKDRSLMFVFNDFMWNFCYASCACVCCANSNAYADEHTVRVCVWRRDDAKIRRCDDDSAPVRGTLAIECKPKVEKIEWQKTTSINWSWRKKKKKQNKRGNHLWLIVAGCRKSHMKCHSFVWMAVGPMEQCARASFVRVCVSSLCTNAIVTELEIIHQRANSVSFLSPPSFSFTIGHSVQRTHSTQVATLFCCLIN